MTVFYISAIMLMRVVQSFFNKKVSLLLPEGVRAYVKYLAVSLALAAAFSGLALVLSGDFSGFNPQSLLIAACSGLSLAFCSLCGIKALSGGTIVLNSIFGTAGLLVPCVLGIFFFDEHMSAPQIAMIAVLLVSAVLLIGSSKKIFSGFSLKTLFWLLGSFLSNGLTMFCQKLFGELQPEGNVALFSLLTFAVPAALLALALPLLPRSGERRSFPGRLVLYAAFLAFAVFVVQQFVTLLTPTVSSAVLFTLVNGGATIIAALVGAAAYGEKLTLRSIAGLVLGLVSLVGIKLFE